MWQGTSKDDEMELPKHEKVGHKAVMTDISNWTSWRISPHNIINIKTSKGNEVVVLLQMQFP